MPNQRNSAMLSSVSAMPSCPSQFVYSERIAKVKNDGMYAYPNIGTSQWTRLSLVFGPSAPFLTSGSSLSVGAWYGLSVWFSSDMGGSALNVLVVLKDDAKGGLEVVGKQQ